MCFLFENRIKQFFSALLIIQVITSSDIREPPRILKEWENKHFYSEKSEHVFDCSATGSGGIIYDFYKDNNPMIHSDPSKSSFRMPKLGSGHAGTYHCTAKNEHGISVSNGMQFKMATQVAFDQTKNPVSVGFPTSKLMIDCKPRITPIVPAGEFTWFHKSQHQDQTEILNSKNTQIDEDGNIHIANLREHHNQDTVFYCRAKNIIVIQWARSRESKFTTLDNTDNVFAPEFMTSSSAAAVSFEGEALTLRCLFSGFPTPDITWYNKSDQSNELLPSDWIRKHDNTHITYKKKADSSVEGSYVCKGSNSEGNAQHEIEVKVESRPRFLHEDDKLTDTIVTEGDDVVMKSLTRSNPTAAIKWSRNGEELDDITMPSNYALNADKSELSISGVCKECDQADIAVIQYKAMNGHGSVYSEASLNVLERTQINEELSTLEDVTWTANEDVLFKMVATSDPFTPLKYQWHWKEGEIVDGNDPRFKVDTDGSLQILMDGEDDGGLSMCSDYNFTATNGYSTDQRSVRLINPGVVAKVGFPWWWILLIVLFLLLLLLLLLCLLLWCCGCCRQQSEDYPVDAKERSRGKDPVKELNSQGFKDYQNRSFTNNDNNEIIDVQDASSFYHSNNNTLKSDVSNTFKRNSKRNSLVVVRPNKSSFKSKRSNDGDVNKMYPCEVSANFLDDNAKYINNEEFDFNNNDVERANPQMNIYSTGMYANNDQIARNNLYLEDETMGGHLSSNRDSGNITTDLRQASVTSHPLHNYAANNTNTNAPFDQIKEREVGRRSQRSGYNYNTETLPDLRSEYLYKEGAVKNTITNKMPETIAMGHEEDGWYGEQDGSSLPYSYHVNQAYNDNFQTLADETIVYDNNPADNFGGNHQAFVEQSYRHEGTNHSKV